MLVVYNQGQGENAWSRFTGHFSVDSYLGRVTSIVQYSTSDFVGRDQL